MTTASPASIRPWTRDRRLWLAGGVAALVGTVVLARDGGQPPAVAEPPRNTPWLEGGRIHYPSTFATREGLELIEARQAMLTPSVHLTGAVTYDPRRVAAVGARISGRLAVLHKVEGESVAAGELVAELESAELGRAQAEVLKARAREQVARADEVRERRLAAAGISAERDAEHAEANAAALTAERVAAVKAVEALGGAGDGALGVLRLRSPLAGRVVEVKARRGETVQASDTLLLVADLSRVWVELAIFERDLASVREGDAVELRTPSDGLPAVQGQVAHVGAVLDSGRRSATVRVEVDNPGLRLRPGHSVVAVVHASGPREERLVVPRRSVTRVDGKPTLFVAVAEGAVEPRTVELGPEDAEQVAVLRGLVKGERVVTGGVLALKSEIFR
jgi:cobalt-zinc-cadmium efflux system membrane fusion protein